MKHEQRWYIEFEIYWFAQFVLRVNRALTLAQKAVPFETGKFQHDIDIPTRRSCREEEQIAYALKQAELGAPVVGAYRKMGASDATIL